MFERLVWTKVLRRNCVNCMVTWLYRLKDDDLAGRMGLQLKELNKIMAVLENDGLIQV